MKRTCYKCNNEKELTEFKSSKSHAQGHDYISKKCDSKDAYQRKLKKCKFLSDYVINYKLSHPCIICGESDPMVLDFHHRVPEHKDDSISEMILKLKTTIENLDKEISKCDILCANHRTIDAR